MKTRSKAGGDTAAVKQENKRSRQETVATVRNIEHLLLPDFLVLCEDYVRGVQNEISIIKTIDFIRPDELPYTPQRLIVIATFFRLPHVPIADFAVLKPECRLVIQTPSRKDVVIGPFPVSPISENDPWLLERLIVDLSGSIEFTSSGPYTVRVEGRTNESPYQTTHWRLLPIAQPAQINKRLTQA